MRDNTRLFAAGLIVLLVATGALTARQRAGGLGPAPSTPIGTIVGRVVDAGTGQPVAEAEVTVAVRNPAPASAPGAAAGMPFRPDGPSPNVRLLTGADGRFVVRDLPAGNVQLTARAPGYVGGSSGQTRPQGPSSPIAISADNKIVPATIRLWKHAVVTGTITDERNEPAVKVMVRILARTYRSGQARFGSARIAFTDDRGAYRFAGIAPGDYVVLVPQGQTTMPAAAMDEMMQSMLSGQGLGGASLDLATSLEASGGGTGVRIGDQIVNSISGAMPVMSANGRMGAYLTQYHPAANSAAEATVITLGSGEERTGVDIRMPLVVAAKVSGTVIGPDGPLAGVQVRLLTPGESDGDMLGDVARSISGANGTFQLFGVPVGTYALKVLRAGRQPLPAAIANNPQLAALMGGRGGPVSPSDALTLFADMPLTVERDVSDLAITLSPGLTVSGRIEFVGTAVVPSSSLFSVTLTPIGSAAMPMRPTPVSEDGRFTSAGMAAGKYLISTSARIDGPGWFVRSAMVNGIDALDEPIELTTENIGNVVVSFTDRRTTVSGAVIDGTNAATQGTVIVFPVGYREWIAKGMSQRLMRNIRTQTKGAFSISGLPARDYLIVAIADDQVPDVQNPNVYEALARVATSLTLGDGDTRTLSLKLAQVGR